MADNLAKKGAPDHTRISLSETYEVTYWTNALGVSKDELIRLIKEHGHSAAKIRDVLGKTS